MKITLLKIIYGISALFLGGTITALFVIQILSAFTTNEIILNVLHLLFTVVLAIVIYRLEVKYLLKN